MGTFETASAALVAVLLIGAPARAGDLAAPPAPDVDWSGFYVGGQAGKIFSVIDETAITDGFNAPFQLSSCTGGLCDGRRDAFMGGLTLGYNLHYADGSLLGVEADIAYTGLDDTMTASGTAPLSPAQRMVATGNLRLQTSYIGTARLRMGYAFGRLLPFITAGIAATYSTVEGGASGRLEVRAPSGAFVPVGGEATSYRGSGFTAGWTAGGGLEYALSDEWSAKADYLYVDLIGSDLGDDPPKLHLWRAGLNYRF